MTSQTETKPLTEEELTYWKELVSNKHSSFTSTGIKARLLATIDQLKRPGEKWAAGPMLCLRCGHKDVMPRKLPDDAIIDCPECKCHAFVAEGIYTCDDDEAVFTCSCGCTLFELVVNVLGDERLFCIGCSFEKRVKS